MAMPVIERRNLEQPLCYDPGRKKFILFEEITSGTENIISVESLSYDDLVLLVVERLRKGPSFTVQSISGIPLRREEVIESVINGDSTGKMTVEAEVSMLKGLLKSIADNLP